MRCPVCDAPDARVVDSRPADDGSTIRRRRQCEACAARFTTFERVEEQPAVVIKRDGRKEVFDRTKIEVGVRSACKGRPVPEDTISALVHRVEERSRAVAGEIESAQVGAFVLEELRPLDGVAAVRFASVYKSFQGPEDFARELELLHDSTCDDVTPGEAPAALDLTGESGGSSTGGGPGHAPSGAG